jgi:hypothetical protein
MMDPPLNRMVQGHVDEVMWQQEEERKRREGLEHETQVDNEKEQHSSFDIGGIHGEGANPERKQEQSMQERVETLRLQVLAREERSALTQGFRVLWEHLDEHRQLAGLVEYHRQRLRASPLANSAQLDADDGEEEEVCKHNRVRGQCGVCDLEDKEEALLREVQEAVEDLHVGAQREWELSEETSGVALRLLQAIEREKGVLFGDGGVGLAEGEEEEDDEEEQGEGEGEEVALFRGKPQTRYPLLTIPETDRNSDTEEDDSREWVEDVEQQDI